LFVKIIDGSKIRKKFVFTISPKPVLETKIKILNVDFTLKSERKSEFLIFPPKVGFSVGGRSPAYRALSFEISFL